MEEKPQAEAEEVQEEPEEEPPVRETEAEVEVHLHNSDSPLATATSFEDLGLKEDILKGVYGMKFVKPSKIQERALPLLLSDPPTNMIGQSQSGTGKTAAFTLTMLSRINPSEDTPQALCLAPARELAIQIKEVVDEMGRYTGIRTYLACGGEPVPRSPVRDHIIIGTPGRVQDMMKRNTLNTKAISVFVLDEADNMIDQQGLGDQSMRIRRMMPASSQVILFSATFPDEVRAYAQRFAPNSNMITLKAEELSVEGIKQFYMDCRSKEHKLEILTALYSLLTIGQSMIFCNHRDTADEVARTMTAQGHTVVSLHGKMEAAERDRVLKDFRDGKTKVLVSTNVIARGIDILQVNMVVNMDLPVDLHGLPDPETYLHRIGRTGRFGRKGVSINLVHDPMSWKVMNAIQDHFGKQIIRVPTDNYDEIEEFLRRYGVH
ncbi:P-loop containing nucleoside triphosphate hydrolase protein [Piptocephalis cylindrospora]|uniref:RNA helicase n=1 Tax=Piptocephalis cylindrospora TaxID=1907219 RepID=A0A4P9Y1C1_9FUNG|nr:P-loop containing nucleoside triphosphate hydrolase protein [Piptocephalis cylindrospora]|eukprot:RKP12312.1 P-loop containing nucleoside triphosphate hydrolase protein [Piptocephalis cylindrospora]